MNSYKSFKFFRLASVVGNGPVNLFELSILQSKVAFKAPEYHISH